MLSVVRIAEIADDIEDRKGFGWQKTIIRLSGRLQSEHLDELKTQSCSSMVAWRGSERLDRQRFDRTHFHQPEPRDRSKDNAQT
jgi:hypothetical protein